MIAAALSALLVASAKGAVAVLAVLAVRAAVGRRIPTRWVVALWLVVAVRLVLPVGPESGWSVFGGEVYAGASRLGPWIGAAEPVAGRGRADAEAVPPGDAPAGLRALASGLGALLRPSDAAAGPLALLWAAGLLVAVARSARDRRRLAAVRGRARPVEDPTALEVLDACRRSLRIRLDVALAESCEVAGPAVCPAAAGRPALVLLPPGAATSLPADRLRQVLLHELAHLAHGDLAARRIARALCAIHWFNPLVHVAARALAADQEVAADARAVTVLGRHRRGDYARTLLALLPVSAPRAHSAPVAFSTTRRQLHRRIAMIASFSPRRRVPALALTALALVFTACALLTDGAGNGPIDEAPTAEPATSTAAAEEATDPQIQALVDMRSIGIAMFAWLADRMPDGSPATHGADATFEWTRCPPITQAELAALLVPRYAEELPAADPWGRPYDLCLDPEVSGPAYRVGVRSSGSDGRFDDRPYRPGPFPPTETSEDLVWIDGFFVRWPEEQGPSR